MLSRDQKPAAASGFRIMVLPDPPRQESQIIVKPADLDKVPHVGIIVGAGLIARDKLYDNGHELGDRVWWGKFAGVMEEWDRILEGKASCEHLWRRVPEPLPESRAWECDHCKGKRRADLMLVMNVDDILANVDLERRLETGKWKIVRGATAAGATTHKIVREDGEIR